MIPREYEKLIDLPGISYYSAGAVRCFAWDYPEAMIDTNTMRIVCRLFNKPIVDSLRRNKKFMELMSVLVDQRNPRLYNFAMLDLADKKCFRRKDPQCIDCPVAEICNYNDK